MNRQQLSGLAVIAREKNILQAAALLSKNPSTLTRMVRSLEKELGVTIFWHTSEGLLPTPEGRQLLSATEKILVSFEELDHLCVGQEGRNWTEQELRYLTVIREKRNLSRAAEELFVAQPSLSQLIHELETCYGSGIFRRTHGGIEETASGALFLDQTGRIYTLFRQLKLDLEDYGQLKKGVITFGIPMHAGAYLLPQVLPKFHRTYPGIDIRIREYSSMELERQLKEEKIEFCVKHVDELQETEEYEILFEDPFFLVIPNDMKNQFDFPSDRPLKAEDLKKLDHAPFIMLSRHQKLRMVVDRILKQAGVRPHVLCKSRNAVTVKRLAGAGMGVTFLPRTHMTFFSQSENLTSYQLDPSLNAGWKLVVSYSRKYRLSRASREFIDMLKESLS